MTVSHSQFRREGGFSLVEIMVGMVIGLISAIVIMQVFALSENQKRTIAGGANAQTGGALALMELQKHLKQSGYGINAFDIIGCDLNLNGVATLTAMAPVTINHPAIPAAASDNFSDTLLIVYGSDDGVAEGEPILGQPGGNNSYLLKTATTFSANDRVIAQARTRPAPCVLFVDRVTGVTATQVTVATGAGGMSQGKLYNLGQSTSAAEPDEVPFARVFAVKDNNLVECNYMINDCGAAGNVGNPAVWVPVASDIVSLRAQYGRDGRPGPLPQDAASGISPAIVNVFDQTTPGDACGWERTVAVRLALVARSTQYERPTEDKNNNPVVATSQAPQWAGNAQSPIRMDTNVYNAAEWQNYRYKVFETTVPLRNMAWMGVQPGC